MRLIQIGAGNMGAWWMQVIDDSDDIEPAALIDIDSARAAALVRKHRSDSIGVYKTLYDALNRVQADAVLDVSPPQFRLAHIHAALDRNMPILIEKPLAASMNDARAIMDMVNAHDSLVVVAQNYRYHVPIMTVKSLLDAGEIGRLSKVTVEHYRGLSLSGFHQQLAYPLLQDMSIHHLDLMRFFLGAEPLTIFARSWNPPGSAFNGDASVAAIFDFPNHVVVTYDASWSSNGLETSWNGNWRFEGEAGVITLRDDVVTVQKRTGKISGRDIVFDEPRVIAPVAGMPSGQHYLLREFYEAVRGNGVPATIAQDNIHSIRMVFKVIESIKSGTVVTFAE